MGIWAVLHEVRSEYAQLLTAVFLLINGPGKWSLDALLHKEKKPDPGIDCRPHLADPCEASSS